MYIKLKTPLSNNTHNILIQVEKHGAPNTIHVITNRGLHEPSVQFVNIYHIQMQIYPDRLIALTHTTNYKN